MLDPRSQSAVWRFGPQMIGHTVSFEVIFEPAGEDSRSRVEATLEYPTKEGGRHEVSSAAMVAVGRVSFSFVFEAYGDLKITLSHERKSFFQETIPLTE